MSGHIDAGGPEVIACPVRRALRLTCQDWTQRLPFVQHEVKEGCHPRRALALNSIQEPVSVAFTTESARV